MEENLLSDATGRNALYKIHVSLGKIVNSLTEKEKGAASTRQATRSVSVMTADEDRTITSDEPTIVPTQPRIEEEAGEDDGDISMASTSRRGSVVDDMLTDEGEVGA